jgi:hypothetical protein
MHPKPVQPRQQSARPKEPSPEIAQLPAMTDPGLWPTIASPLGVRVAGTDRVYELTLTTIEVGELMGLCDASICRLAEQGLIPTLPRRGKGSTWRIPAKRLLDSLGIACEVMAR